MATSALASLTKEREAWNKVMTSTYGIKLKGQDRFKRTTRRKQQKRNNRSRKYKASLVSMDDDARAALADERIAILEATNHNVIEAGDAEEDEDYVDSEDESAKADGGRNESGGDELEVVRRRRPSCRRARKSFRSQRRLSRFCLIQRQRAGLLPSLFPPQRALPEDFAQ